ncbi:hypothetical protein [Mixta calida]|uniref:hypothetical protein n=1 Tax=Mixta calida TaxID=665913 RepID=UPI00403AB8E0
MTVRKATATGLIAIFLWRLLVGFLRSVTEGPGAIGGATTGRCYCVITKKIAGGSNGISLFFILTAVTLWMTFFFNATPAFHFSMKVAAELFNTKRMRF